MTIIFNDADLTSAYRQQRNILRVYIAVAVVFAAICAACLVYFISLPYEDPNQIIPKIIICVASCLFVIFSYVFMGIKYHRARKYYKLISYLSVGMKQVNNSYFLRYEEPELRDGVDYYVLIFSEWSKKKSEYMDRKIYADNEKERPEFHAVDRVRYLTPGNVIVEYEVLYHDEEFIEQKKREDAEKKPIRMGDI